MWPAERILAFSGRTQVEGPEPRKLKAPGAEKTEMAMNRGEQMFQKLEAILAKVEQQSSQIEALEAWMRVTMAENELRLATIENELKSYRAPQAEGTGPKNKKAFLSKKGEDSE